MLGIHCKPKELKMEDFYCNCHLHEVQEFITSHFCLPSFAGKIKKAIVISSREPLSEINYYFFNHEKAWTIGLTKPIYSHLQHTPAELEVVLRSGLQVCALTSDMEVCSCGFRVKLEHQETFLHFFRMQQILHSKGCTVPFPMVIRTLCFSSQNPSIQRAPQNGA